MGREPDASIPAAGRHDRGGDVRHVPPARHREVRRALRDPARPRRAGALAGGAGHRVLGLRLRRRAAAASSARAPACRRRSRSRTSRCSRTGRPPTPWPRPPDKASRVNLLNWDGKGSPTGLFPARPERATRRAVSRTATTARRTALTDAQLTVAWQAASLLLGYPDEELLGRLDLIEAAAARLPERVGEPLRGVRRAPPGDAADRAGGGLRRDLRQPPPAQPVPHLLRPRRHPQAGDGAAAVQADLPRVGLRADDARAARPPVRGAGVRRHRRPRAGPAADPRPPGRARAAPDLARRGRLAAGPAPSRRSRATLPPLRGDEWTRSAGWPPRGRPPRRSA